MPRDGPQVTVRTESKQKINSKAYPSRTPLKYHSLIIRKTHDNLWHVVVYLSKWLRIFCCFVIANQAADVKRDAFLSSLQSHFTLYNSSHWLPSCCCCTPIYISQLGKTLSMFTLIQRHNTTYVPPSFQTISILFSIIQSFVKYDNSISFFLHPCRLWFLVMYVILVNQ